ncbi:MAG: RDD family protein [Anaerolineales bacterium]
MTFTDEWMSIDTPENVIFNYEVAGIGSRFMAALVDSLLILVLQVVVYVPLIALIMGLGMGALQAELVIWAAALLGLLSFIFLWGYYVFFEIRWNGQSPGKRWVGVRVIRTDGTPISATESLIRNFVRLVDFLPLYYGVGVVTMFLNDEARRLGDFAAGTIVVREGQVESPDTLRAVEGDLNRWAARTEPGNDPLPVERLSNSDIQMAEDYLARRATMHDSQRVGRSVARVLLEKMELQARAGEHTADDWIRRILYLTRSREG